MRLVRRNNWTSWNNSWKILGKLAVSVALDPSAKEACRYLCDKQWSPSTGQRTFYLCCSVSASVKQMVSLIVHITDYAVSWYTYVCFNNWMAWIIIYQNTSVKTWGQVCLAASDSLVCKISMEIKNKWNQPVNPTKPQQNPNPKLSL